MKKILLDSNFIVTCVKQKIDFFEELKFMGLKILIPKQVLREIKGIKKPEAELSLKILGKNKFEEVEIGRGHVDKKIKNYADKNPEILVATLDNELKKKLKNQKVIIKGKRKLGII